VPRRAHAGASVGTYIALATANRVMAPCSKLGFADWWASTAGPRWVKVEQAALDHRRFWAAMDRLTEADLRVIAAELGRRMIAEYGLDLAALVLDMTNFATSSTPATTGRRSRSAVGRSRNAPTFAWSGWRWWSPAMVTSRWCRTPTPGTARTSPSSRP
jgi:hypothetical protein